MGVGRADAPGVPEEIGGANVWFGGSVGPGGIGVGVGARVGAGVGFPDGRGLRVGRGVGAGVGVAVAWGPTTTTVGPLSVGLLPGVVAANVTSQVPAGSVEWPVHVPSVAVPLVSVSPIDVDPTTAVTALAACWGLGVT